MTENCSICYEPLDEGNTTSLPCTHTFHLDCVCKWFDVNINCPLCRSDPLQLQRYQEYQKRYKTRSKRKTGHRYKKNHRKN